MTVEFKPWAATKRLFRDVTVTEKIDGTNVGIHFEQQTGDYTDHRMPWSVLRVNGDTVEFGAQSRKKLITPEEDNFGFAFWVWNNTLDLFNLLGYGSHYGEWWGSGIQRGYGLPKGERRFSLFNTRKWGAVDATVGGVQVRPVPVLYQGVFEEAEVKLRAESLQKSGSVAAPGFAKPEGICIYWHETDHVSKYTPYHGNDGHKGNAR